MRIALPLILLGMIFYLAWPTKNSQRGYEELMSITHEKEEAHGLHRQQRQGIRKDFYDRGTHSVLSAPESTLILENFGGSVELVEVLPKFHLVMHEDATHVRDVHATEGMFYYLQERVTAKKALVSRLIDEKPSFKGAAGSLEVGFSDGLKFKAGQVKATLFGEEIK